MRTHDEPQMAVPIPVSPRSEHLRVGLCYFDTDLRYVSINPWLATIHGLTPEDHLGRTIGEVLPATADVVGPQLRQVIESGESLLNGLAYAETAAHPGLKRLYQYDYYADKAEDGTVLGVRCLVHDLTPQELLEVAGVIPWEAGAGSWEFSYVGSQAEEMLGYPVAQWYTEGFWSSRIHPADRDHVLSTYSAYSLSKTDFELEYRMIRADGESGWFRDVVSVESLTDVPVILRGYLFDISDLKEAQEHVERSERRFRRFLESAPDALILLRRDGTIVFANDQVTTLFGYPPEALTGELLEKLIPRRFRTNHGTMQNKFFADPAPRRMGDGRVLFGLRDDGTEFPVDISLNSLESEGDLLVSVAIRDISDTVAADRALNTALGEVEDLRRRLEAENLYLRDEIRQAGLGDELVGESIRMRQVQTLISQVAPTDAAVLILGETGTGKELVAKAVHERSPREGRPLVKVNCATLPASLIESELFGHTKGAFTGAVSERIGRFELADGGSIFLDEIGDLPLELQPKLLRVLQDGKFERLGATETLTVNVRVIAATNHDLEQAVSDGRFREDLFFRLAVFPLHLPPLRERIGDIPLLVWYLLGQIMPGIGKRIDTVPNEVMQQLVEYSWPGNVRELENVLERALILTPGTTLHLETGFGRTRVGRPHHDALSVESTRIEDIERAHILRVLEACDWRIKGRSNAAERLGLHPSTLTHRLKKLGIQRPS